jgi:hypothetical protein
LLLTGDPTVTDPACSLAPTHHLIEAEVAEANADLAVAEPSPASSFSQLQRETGNLWNYRTDPR